MQLTIIGSGTGTPQKKRSAPCCLLRHESESVVIDLGPGSTRGLLVHGGITVREVGLILITHFHPDHCSDLAPFLFALRTRGLERNKRLEIMGPPGLESHFQALRDLWEHRVDPLDYELGISEWTGGEKAWGPFHIEAAPTIHSVPNLAWMVKTQSGQSVIVTGDGEPTGEIEKMCRSVRHVLVAECSLPSGGTAAGHMSPGQAGGLARRCRSDKLVLTHLNPEVQTGPAKMEARKYFSGEVVVAEDGMIIDI